MDRMQKLRNSQTIPLIFILALASLNLMLLFTTPEPKQGIQPKDLNPEALSGKSSCETNCPDIKPDKIAPEEFFIVQSKLHPKARYLGEHDLLSRTLSISQKGYKKVECSHDDGFKYSKCDGNGTKLIWTKKDYLLSTTLYIKFTKDNGEFEEYSFNPAQYNPKLTFLSCDETLVAGGEFGILQNTIDTVLDENNDQMRIVCIAPGLVFTNSKQNNVNELLPSKAVYIVGTQSNRAIIKNEKKLGRAGLFKAKAGSRIILANLKLSTSGLFGHAVVSEKNAYVGLNYVEIETHGDVSHAIMGTGGTIELHASDLRTHGNSSVSLFAHKLSFVVPVLDTKFTTYGKNSPAVYVAGGSLVTISNSIIEANSLSDSSHALFIDDGIVTIKGSSLEAFGPYTTAVQIDNLGLLGNFISDLNTITAHTVSNMAAISYVQNGQFILYDTTVINSGNGLEVAGGSKYMAVSLENSTFILSMDAKADQEYFAVKLAKTKDSFVHSLSNSNKACSRGSAIYSEFVRGKPLKGSTFQYRLNGLNSCI